MAFHVGLGQHVHAVFVAEVVEYGIVRVVRGTDGVDIQALHAKDILLNFFGRDSTAIDR